MVYVWLPFGLALVQGRFKVSSALRVALGRVWRARPVRIEPRQNPTARLLLDILLFTHNVDSM